MASPFPGMDPYLETPAFWRDFHTTFIVCWREAIGAALPDNYEARLDESVSLVEMSADTRKLIFPDVAVTRQPRRTKGGHGRESGTLLLEPVVIPHEILDEIRQPRVEILHRPDRKLVAVLELLSPFNKSGEGYDQYRAKRNAILGQKVHLVELDLLLDGKRLPLSKPLPNGDYYALISRANDRPNCEVYHWALRDPLPIIPIPLRAPDADIPIDLGQVFRDTYERGRYARSLFYAQPPMAPLSRKDAQWAISVAAQKPAALPKRK
jgi:Protein of unknown function (DUF4058)